MRKCSIPAIIDKIFETNLRIQAKLDFHFVAYPFMNILNKVNRLNEYKID